MPPSRAAMSDMSGRLLSAHARTRLSLAALVVAASLISACLVTSKADFDQLPIPSVVTREMPLSEFERFREQADEACLSIGNGDGHMLFTVNISDLNKEEDLEVRTLVNDRYVDQPEGDVVATGQVERKPFAFCIPASELKKPCSRLDVLVSSAFKSPKSTSKPKIDDDIAGAHWYVIGSAADDATASYLDCPGVPDAGVQ
jgi:hypothetical protein